MKNRKALAVVSATPILEIGFRSAAANEGRMWNDYDNLFFRVECLIN